MAAYHTGVGRTTRARIQRQRTKQLTCSSALLSQALRSTRADARRIRRREMERRVSMAGKPRTTITAVYGKTEDRYLDLVRQFPLRPLRSDADLDAAVAAIDGLLDRPKLTAPERDYLDVLSDLVEAYEAETIPM